MRQKMSSKPARGSVLFVWAGIIVFIIGLADLMFGFLPKGISDEFLIFAGMVICIMGIILCAATKGAGNDVHHRHFFAPPRLVENAPTKSGHRTDYSFQVCAGCNMAVIFDKRGYLSTTDEHKRWIKDELASHGITLLVDA